MSLPTHPYPYRPGACWMAVLEGRQWCGMPGEFYEVSLDVPGHTPQVHLTCRMWLCSNHANVMKDRYKVTKVPNPHSDQPLAFGI